MIDKAGDEDILGGLEYNKELVSEGVEDSIGKDIVKLDIVAGTVGEDDGGVDGSNKTDEETLVYVIVNPADVVADISVV